MKKTLGKILVAVLVIGVLLVAAFATGKKAVESITLDEFNSLIKKEAVVYYGPANDEEAIKELATKLDIKINLLDSNAEKSKELEAGSLYAYKNGEELFKYRGNLSSYKVAEELMKNGFMDRTYLTVSLSEYKEIMKSSGYNFMFIGRETCGYCSQFKESINEAMKDYDFMIYYIDTDTFASEDEFNELVATDSYMSENEWGTPLSFLYKDGKRVNVLNGYVETSELIKFLKDNKVVE